MANRYLREADAWNTDKARFTTDEWSKQTLLEVSAWRAWNNIDVARRTRGRGAQAGTKNQQKDTWRTFVAVKVADGGLDTFDIEVAETTLAWLKERGYHPVEQRDSSGGEESVEYYGVTIKPLWPDGRDAANPDRYPMPAVLKKAKPKSRNADS